MKLTIKSFIRNAYCRWWLKRSKEQKQHVLRMGKLEAGRHSQ